MLKKLPPQDLANIYSQLARLEKAGMPITNAIELLTTGEAGKRAELTLKYIKRGKPLSEAGAKSGLLVGLDITLIKVAEASGKNAEIFQQLAQFNADKASQARRIKSRLILPIIMLVLAIFIQPIPDLFLGKTTVGGYFLETVGLIALLASSFFILSKLTYLNNWQTRRNLLNFIQSLGLMLQAGLPILEALPKAYQVVENTDLRKQLRKISVYLKAGDNFAEAFSKLKLNKIANQFILTGEHSGNLAEMLLHYSKQESEDIALHDKMITTWIPRFVYAIIAIWIIYGIIGSTIS
ncbi:type II secretion system F family protein [Candidatus Halobeggiatoa sp. HSG11]|nr:type II secretion system F family protein [Candidatus Halobeggiatoa sp. HSG11]